MTGTSALVCFVAMPFRPELHYFYLYVQTHLSHKYRLVTERGDHTYATVPLIEKIKGQILRASVVIVDITGRNPNVFYELGVADTNGKRVILITQDDIAESPVDVRHREIIHYQLDKDVDFLSRLDKAIESIFEDNYRDLYDEAIMAYDAFCQLTSYGGGCLPLSTFQVQVMGAPGGVPPTLNGRDRAEYLLMKVVQDPTDIKTIEAILAWRASTT